MCYEIGRYSEKLMGFKMVDLQSAGCSRSKPELEVKLDCGKPFRAKPFAKHVTFDKFSADGCGKGP